MTAKGGILVDWIYSHPSWSWASPFTMSLDWPLGGELAVSADALGNVRANIGAIAVER